MTIDSPGYKTLLEGLAINQELGLIGWVDIEQKKVFKRSVNGNCFLEFDYPFVPSNIFELDDEKALLLDDHGVCEFLWRDQTLNRVFDFSYELVDKGFRGNDGVKLPDGSIFFGSMHKSFPLENPGALWLLIKDKISKVDTNTIPNLFVRMDEGVLVADSHTKLIYKYQMPPLSTKEVWADLSAYDGEPDGGCLSNNGSIYIAHWGAAQLLKLTTNGEVIDYCCLKVKHPTNCKQYKEKLFVSSATAGLSQFDVIDCVDAGKILEVRVF